jgi:hypothetical protein
MTRDLSDVLGGVYSFIDLSIVHSTEPPWKDHEV